MNRIEEVRLAISYIEKNLTERLDLNIVSDAVGYSKFHLHRIFSQTIGITARDYIQRRRLTEAAKLLVFSGRPIIDVAFLYGYRSQQAFTSAFTAMYKMPPSKYRENEKFYPLQLRFEFEGSFDMLSGKDEAAWENLEAGFAAEEDIPGWMALVRLVIDGFPNWQEEEYMKILKQKIDTKQALIVKDGSGAIGIMLFSGESGTIDFMGCHPLYRKRGIPEKLLQKMMVQLMDEKEISITTYREGDKADHGYRKELKGLGFTEAELLMEYGYPTQRFVLQREE